MPNSSPRAAQAHTDTQMHQHKQSWKKKSKTSVNVEKEVEKTGEHVLEPGAKLDKTTYFYIIPFFVKLKNVQKLGS